MTTTTTTTTHSLLYTGLYEYTEDMLEPATLCMTFDVEDSLLPDPILHIYLPSGFRSVSPTCGDIGEANLTLFPQCLGQPFASAQQASCEEMYDPRHLQHFLKLSVAGFSNASLGHAFQFQVKVPRVKPKINSWSVHLWYNERAAWQRNQLNTSWN